MTVLNHFQTVTGLKVNFDKTRIIPLNHNPSWTSWPVVSSFVLVPYGTGFKYLGVTLTACRNVPSANNFPLNANLIQEVLKQHPIMTTCITGRILQIKALVASKFVSVSADT